MEDLENKSVLELTMRLNQIDREIQDLNLEYNLISFELQNRIPSLKGDKDLKMRGVKNEKEGCIN